MTETSNYPTLGERLRHYAKQTGLARVAKGFARGLGYDLVRRNYYSPIPDLAKLPHDVWDCPGVLSGIPFDPEHGLDFVRRELAPFLAEYSPPYQPTQNARDFYLENGFYGPVDAELLYAMVRHLAPRRVIELGSGASTLVIADARAAGRRQDAEHVVFDPFPRPELVDVLASVAELHRVSATDVPLARFKRLEAGDVLFVDTTHTVKIASDVNRIILDVLPTLAPGVFIHFHDIFLPWEYSPRLFDMGFVWAEQYLLQAFLAFNDQFEVMLSAHALQRRFPNELADLVRSAPAPFPPSSFWVRRAAK